MEPSQLLSRLTRKAMAHVAVGYLTKDTDEYALIEEIKRKHGLEDVYRFDIGKNTDGYSPLVQGVLEEVGIPELSARNLIEYPDNHYNLLRQKLAERFRLRADWFALSAGLESMIDHVSRSFLEAGDRFLLPVPNFDVFEEHSSRVGGEPFYQPLDEAGLHWTEATTEALVAGMEKIRPKLVWVSNPINPTGQLVSLGAIKRLAEKASECDVILVVDEAYGEYTDTDEEIVSAARYLERFSNLLVLRTFSKMYAIPSVRVGYAMCSSPDVIAAVNLYRPVFPFSWFSLFIAQIAFADDLYLHEARSKLIERKKTLYRDLEGLKSFEFVPSDVNTVMLRHRTMSAEELSRHLETKGILVANLDRMPGIQRKGYVRMTVRSRRDNAYFIAVCRELDRS